MLLKDENVGLLQGSERNVHVLLWTDVITIANLERSLDFARRLAATHPSGIVAVNIVAHGLSIPDSAAQRRANEVSKTLDESVLATAVVLPGEGFWVGAARAFLTGLNMVSPLKGKRTIARTIEQGFAFAAPYAERDATWASQSARTVETWAGARLASHPAA